MGEFKGLIDLIAMKALYYKTEDMGSTITETEIPEDLLPGAELWREKMLNSLADKDERFTEGFMAHLEGAELPTSEIAAAQSSGEDLRASSRFPKLLGEPRQAGEHMARVAPPAGEAPGARRSTVASSSAVRASGRRQARVSASPQGTVLSPQGTVLIDEPSQGRRSTRAKGPAAE